MIKRETWKGEIIPSKPCIEIALYKKEDSTLQIIKNIIGDSTSRGPKHSNYNIT
jgi:hypothetical protein